ncbi:GNAT family N-acetyltransferase [Bacillus sp. V3B]|uniref:GNAT family N-acetyltransferase n=1 Tax=Bacillus sp. V3B TaxID=2804915 RepID=UPI0021087DDA|nr:GNAT family N-acetyltransferase [Bacillus sp. V3B]MCQ6273951.1 GNAT family N-acetyltransferase [Bacillus sp. V3B]
MDFTIRLAEEDQDIISVHQIMLEAFAEYDSYDIPSSAMNEPVSSIKKLIQNGSEKAILCFVEEKALGSVRFKMNEDSLYFSRLSVVPEARGKGTAKAMIKWLGEYAQEKGKDKIFCRVRKDTPQNVQFYRSYDFEISKEETIINKDGNLVEIIEMNKKANVLIN